MNKHTQPWSGNSQLRNLSLQLYVSTRTEKVELVASDKILISNSESDDADFYISFANLIDVLLSSDNTWTGRQSVSEVALTSTSNSVAIDASQGNSFYHLLTENTTFAAPTNLKSGTYNFLIKQDSSSAYTLAFNSAFLFPDGVDPVMTTTLGGLMLVSCMYSESSSTLVCTSIKDFS